MDCFGNDAIIGNSDVARGGVEVYKKRVNMRVAAVLVLAIIIILGTGLRSLVNFITDFQWFGKNEFLNTFLVRILTELGILIPLWILAGIGLYVYIKRLNRKYCANAHVSHEKQADKRINQSIGIFSALSGGAMAWAISDSIWLKLRMFLNSTPFDSADPIFGKNIDFYLFKLPLYQQLLTIGIIVTFLLIVVTVGFFFIMRTLMPPSEDSIYYMNEFPKRPNVISLSSIPKNELFISALRKIVFLGMIIFLLVSAKYFLRTFELMYSTEGVAYGASYTDIHVTLIGYRVAAAVSLVSAFIFAFGLLKRRFKLAVSGPVLLFSVNIIFAIAGFVVQQLIVEPDEIGKEKEFLVYNIEHTQEAFALDDVTISEFPVEQSLVRQDLIDNATTVENIRINDARPLKETYNQIQGIRLYYLFNDIDLDRYVIDGDYTQVFISPRELDQDKLSDQAKTWINMHLKFTHGYGVVMSPVNAVTEEGQPQLIFKNVPPITDTDLIINRPELYFGEMDNRYVVINTDEPEFDYPYGSDNVTSRYEGSAGIELGGINKLLFAYREKSMKLLFSTIVNRDSRIIFYRNIKDRVDRIAPFLDYDSNPYLVLNQEDGKLYWIIDAYTTSKYYPYSQPFKLGGKDVNYMRNSVKVVIDAYEGTTKFYVFDEEDPVVKTYGKIFTDLFTAKSELTPGMLNHVRYPQDYFDMQSEVYRTYHVDNPVVFYNGEDIWDIANEKYMDGVQRIESNYVMFKLPDSESKEFALILPYTPREKPNMTSLFVARSDGEKYGNLYMYKFPKDKTIQGPLMIESRIDQDSLISPQFTLWGQRGSAVLRGNLIVVPIEDSLIYVEPIYLKADNPKSLPEMKRVIVAYQNKIVMEETLDKALSRIFGGDEIEKPSETIPVEGEIEQEVQRLLGEINRLFNQNKDNMDEIERLIDQINQLIERQSAEGESVETPAELPVEQVVE